MTDWRAGDFAIAKRDLPPSTITGGKFLTVSEVVHHPILGMGLRFVGVALPKGYIGCNPACFIKVTPPREMIEEERKAGVPA